MIDSSKKQQQGFPEILTAGDFEPVKEKECLEGSNQKSLKEGQCAWPGAQAPGPCPPPARLRASVCAVCPPCRVSALCACSSASLARSS